MPDHAPRHERLGGLRAAVTWNGGIVTLALEGELDMASAAPFDRLLGEVEGMAPRAIVVDLTALAFMDSSGIRLLVVAHRRAAELGHRFAVRDGSGPAHRSLELVQLDDAFPMVDSAGPAD